MLRTMMKAKIHNAAITAANLNYMGSITIDGALMDEVDILEHERVQVVNVNNGARFDTYTIRGEEGSGVICLNGPAAHGMRGRPRPYHLVCPDGRHRGARSYARRHSTWRR